ncbi:type I restriction enzyme HsdR N-terminal domain-containing protein [Spirulina sp. CCNP1310]|uniref:type I restriction enzyme HsdR N-terminal domain-containing protein n=1 Tax=Spirulina sp. CCNP1310 TaxID=3110249 RepID=UPI002B2128C6|nr:type I restriction enzyme HsdR N-terminal domain-containing protein [Spirulina sp. CCNP1310]MEA5420504.1 type I restriction enzyme HsdR N-terminal domain-containing protein [Spirulina sp. CCNP1310]
MSQAIAASEVTLRLLKESLHLQAAPDQQFFSEWQQNTPPLSDLEQQSLDRVKLNFLDLLEDPPVLENSVKLVILAPLLDLAGFYRRPFRITTETSTNLELVDAGMTIRGRIDVLVVNGLLWLVVIESKRSDFAVVRALPQTLAYLLANPNPPQPTFGLITNGTEYLFLKASRTPSPQYATSRLFSLFNPGNELYPVLAILKQITPERSL